MWKLHPPIIIPNPKLVTSPQNNFCPTGKKQTHLKKAQLLPLRRKNRSIPHHSKNVIQFTKWYTNHFFRPRKKKKHERGMTAKLCADTFFNGGKKTGKKVMKKEMKVSVAKGRGERFSTSSPFLLSWLICPPSIICLRHVYVILLKLN